MSTGTYQFQSEFALRHISQGEAKALLTVLASRGVNVPDEARDRITGCTDLDQLDRWLRRAATAGSVDELFTDETPVSRPPPPRCASRQARRRAAG